MMIWTVIAVVAAVALFVWQNVRITRLEEDGRWEFQIDSAAFMTDTKKYKEVTFEELAKYVIDGTPIEREEK